MPSCWNHAFATLIARKLVADINAIIGACARSVAMQRAVDIVAAMQAGSVQPTLVTYNTLLHAYDRMRLTSKAFEALEAMQANRIEPDVLSFTSLVSACGRTREADRARHVLSTMQASRVEPNLFTYSALMAAYKIWGSRSCSKHVGRDDGGDIGARRCLLQFCCTCLCAVGPTSRCV